VGIPWKSAIPFKGQAYTLGSRSLYWGGWSPRLLDEEMATWPPAIVADLNGRYFDESSRQIGVDEAKDEYRIRRASVLLTPTPRDQELWTAMDAVMQKVAAIFANGQPMQVIQSNRDGRGTTHHEAGTLWVGEDPARSVTTPQGRFHHTENLYAAGAALSPSIGSPNPMLTGIALSRRTGDFTVAVDDDRALRCFRRLP
jgi:choline dehydrogenase-like flavoprotein